MAAVAEDFQRRWQNDTDRTDKDVPENRETDMQFKASFSGGSEADKDAAVIAAENYCEALGIDASSLHQDVLADVSGASEEWNKIESAAMTVFKGWRSTPNDFCLEWV